MSRRTRRCRTIHPNLLVIGVDVAKKRHVAVASAADGRLGKPLKLANSHGGFGQLIAYAERWQARLDAQGYVLALEPTGHYGEPLVHWAAARGIQVYAVQPLFTNRAKELFDGRPRKTDSKDAAVIADLCRRGLARRWRVLGEPFASLRVLSRQREQLVKRRSQCLNRLHRHLDVVFPEVWQCVGKAWSATALWVLGTVPTPAAVLALGLEELTAGLRKASRGQLGPERAEELLQAARTSVGVTVASQAHTLAVQQLLVELSTVVRQIAQIERQMQRALQQVPYADRLLSIPRLGKVTAATLLGEFGDLTGYRVAKQLIAMAGLDLVEVSSGEHKGRRRISRRGRRYGRQMLFLAALRMGGGVLSEPHRRMVEVRKVPPMKAAVANMCRLLRIMHALVRDDVDFDSERYDAPAEEARAA